MRGEIVGRITIVQEDRIRVVDARGRGYLLTVGKRRATPDQLAAWQRELRLVRLRYRGRPDLGAVVDRIAPAEPAGRAEPPLGPTPGQVLEVEPVERPLREREVSVD